MLTCFSGLSLRSRIPGKVYQKVEGFKAMSIYARAKGVMNEGGKLGVNTPGSIEMSKRY
jgi:hypothetical protein